jgi:energy-coupling factor transporter ATP-binding protein EcfA2
MIVFEKLRYKNLLSTGDSFTEIPLNNNRLTLIVGDNGSGKSTIVDALTLALYGKPFRKINKPQLVNSINGKGLVVEVEFSIGNKHYKVVRKIKPNVFELYLNDELVNQDANMRDYQEMLEKKILKLNYKAFCQVVILGNASFIPFMQLAAGDRRIIIEELLDLQIFSVMNNLLKQKSADNKALVGECENHIRSTEEKIKLQKENIKEQNEIIQGQIEEHKEKLDEAVENVNFYIGQVAAKEKKLGEIFVPTNNIIECERVKRELQEQVTILSGELREATKNAKFYSEHENCPTCEQEIDAEFRTARLMNAESESKKLELTLDAIKNTLLPQNENQLLEYQEEVKKAHDLEVKIRIDKHSLKMQEETKIEHERVIEKLKNSLHDDIQDNTKLKTFEETLGKLIGANQDIKNKQNVYDVTFIILKDTGVKAQVIKQFVEIINQLINKYLSDLGFFCQFELDETFTETIKSRHRDEFSYASFSEGEKMRINLAVLLTWRAIARMRNSASTNLLVMDEVFDSSLDSAGTDFFIKILNDLTNDTNVFIISHKGDQMIDQFENLIQFEKKKNFSQIRGD